MGTQPGRCRLAGAMLAVLISVMVGVAAPAPETAEPRAMPKPLPPEIVAVWKKAGAEVGWMRVEESPFRFVFHETPQPGDLPAFRLVRWEPGISKSTPVHNDPPATRARPS
jgi:hypothetical protein